MFALSNSIIHIGQSYNSELLMKKEPRDFDILRIFKNYENSYNILGKGLDVNVNDLTYNPKDPTEALLLVLSRWRAANIDVTWEKIEKVCLAGSERLGKVLSNLREYLSTKEAHDKYLK